MALSRRIRFEILRRDGHTCRYCGASAPDVTLTVDHVIPVALGGGDEPNNLVTACQDCNAGKGSTSPDEHIVEDVDATAMLFAKAMERAAELRSQENAATAETVGWFAEMWPTTYHLPGGWQTSIETWLNAGLDPASFARFAWKAANSDAYHPWKYLCGCCWNEIGIRQELARRLIEDGEV